jgi:metal-sulfur cluster biosynthetic enzyme
MKSFIWQALSQINDPEIGENIVDLGLVYDVNITTEKVCITMTMTSPSCPMIEIILDEIEQKIKAILPADTILEINLVSEPAWHPGMMSVAAKKRLGWL